MSETPVPYDAGYQSLKTEYEAVLNNEEKALADLDKAREALIAAKQARILVECKLNAWVPPGRGRLFGRDRHGTPPPTWSEG